MTLQARALESLRRSLKCVARGEKLKAQAMADWLPLTLNPDGMALPIAALLMGLQARGPDADEIFTALDFFRSRATPFPVSMPVFDCAGTGGDQGHTLNISTAMAFVMAAGGIPVVKHGNRAASSTCGSADVLEAAGLPLEWSVADWLHTLKATGFAFLYAPSFHPALKPMATLRKQMGFPTLFNLLGPLLNPARPAWQLVGVGEQRLAPVVADVMARLPIKRAFVVHSRDGWDEISPFAPTDVWDVRPGHIDRFVIEPSSVPLGRMTPPDLRGDTPQHNAKFFKELLGGLQSPYADTVALNAAAGFMLTGHVNTLQQGFEKAKELIASKQTLLVFNNVIQSLYKGSSS